MADNHEQQQGEPGYPSPIIQSYGNSSGSRKLGLSNESDARLKALLDQQARIQAEIKALLPSKNGIDTRQEQIMLNHKHKILKSCQEELGLATVVLSNEEECRLLQYRCECLEAACLQSGKYSSVNDLLERGSLPLRPIQPAGFDDWLQTNATKYDPVLKFATDSRQTETAPSLKCSEIRCIHYVYGFNDPEGLRSHRLEEHPHSESYLDMSFPASEMSGRKRHERPSGFGYQRDVFPRPNFAERMEKGQLIAAESVSSNLPFSSTSNLPDIYPREHMTSRPMNFVSPGAPATSQPVAQEISRQTSASSNLTYSFIPEYPSMAKNSLDSPWSTLLYPSKRTRLTPSIDESKLMREVGPCLRCKVLKKKCDTGDPCSLCPEQDSSAESDYWKVLGCHRGPLVSFAEILVPAGESSQYDRHQQLQSDHIAWGNRIFTEACWNACAGRALDLSDLRDEFCSAWSKIPEVPRGNPLDLGLPPVYVLLQMMNQPIPTTTEKNLLRLLSFSAQVSKSQENEYQEYPLLSLSKRLLREAIIFQMSHDVFFRKSISYTYERYTILYSCATNFLTAFDDVTQKRVPWDPENWIVAFCSLCFLQATSTFLVLAIRSVYKALASIFTWSTPSLLDEKTAWMGEDDRDLFIEMIEITGKDTWADHGIQSTKDFLMGLESRFLKDWSSEVSVEQERLSGNMSMNPPSSTMSRPEVPDSVSHSTMHLDRSSEDTNIPSMLMSHSGPRLPFTSSSAEEQVAMSKPVYQRPRSARVYCKSCDSHPDGFRGEHDLRRHQDRAHKIAVKKWICVEPTGHGHPKPELPLSKCKACWSQKKKYGAYYNAAAHLRRAHFKFKARATSNRTGEPEKRGGKGGGDWPPMSELKHWMKEVEEPREDYSASTLGQTLDDDDEEDDPVITRAAMGSYRDTSYFGNSSTRPASLTFDNNFPPSSLEWMQPELSTATRPERQPCPYPGCGMVVTDLQTHMLRHPTEKPEKCPIATCEYHTKGFARKYDMIRHTLTHYEGTIVCPFCRGVGTPAEKSFSRADVMKRHLMSSHGVEHMPVVPWNIAARAVRRAVPFESPSGESGKCSICKRVNFEAQKFYEHLDDCVLAVVAPSLVVGKVSEGSGTAMGDVEHSVGDRIGHGSAGSILVS
ncbi:hypothetical protein LSUE1_G005700 [Lachnellula suecica]|uniref:C2H2-type domain-containing protein n=1 Tax=Lachnellula suecica TaxID=602035 RepID=A0A8T9CAG4_9HELO|nr:hypothetical protein LSUE1_G005700 [Lachnellula suecica]